MASIDFTELFTNVIPSATATWTSIDLSSYGVPDNAVVSILLVNSNAEFPITVGVREVGSSLARYVDLHEAEGGGSTSIVMHVQADSSGSIQYYTGLPAFTDLYILGYYGSGITYTEEMTLYDSTVADWRTQAVGQNNRVFEFSCQNETDGDEVIVGVRGVGSSLARYYDIDEAEPSGSSGYTSYAQSDGSGNVQLYREDTRAAIYSLGYFSANVQLAEAFTNCTPSSDATWRELTAAGFENTVALIACMHNSSGTEELMGARGGASTEERRWTEHEAEGGGFAGDTLPVLVDAGGKYDTYHGDVSDALFYCLGYLYDTGSAPAGWTGKICGVTNPSKICGIAVADITKVCGV